jgi:hypothetical protein
MQQQLYSMFVPMPKPTRQEISQLSRDEQWEELHRRMNRERSISDPEFELEDAEDEFAVTLQEIAPTVKSKLTYWYDFGDDWYHRIDVVKVGPPAEPPKPPKPPESPEPPEPPEGVAYPVCLAGKLACPPEDCGGIWGYYEMLEALKDPKHENHEDMLEWLGDGFDPERFDIDEVNAVLAELR